MAPAHSTIFSLLSPSNNPITNSPQTHPLLLASSTPTSNPPTVKYKRKNHLRPKILKTLIKSHPPITHLPPQQSPSSTPRTTEVEDSHIEVPIDELEELSHSEMTTTTTTTSGDFNGSGVVGKISAKSVLKYGVVLFGAFVLQTIFSAVIMLNDELKKKDGDLEGNDGEKRSLLINGGGKTFGVNGESEVVSLMGQLEMDRKIEEIKVMAREVRRIEGVKKEEGEIADFEGGDESGVSGDRLGIEEEIGARLLNLEDRVDSDKDSTDLLHFIKNLEASVKSSSGGLVKENRNVDKGNGSLMFRKKLKFKSPSTKQRKAPKGFPGSKDYKASDAVTKDSSSEDKAKPHGKRSTNADHVQTSLEDKLANQQDVGVQEADSKLSLEVGGTLSNEEANTLQDTGKNFEEVMVRSEEGTGTQVENNRRNNGGFAEDCFGRSSVEVIQSRNSKAKQANTGTDMWWLNLRYVIVIKMRRGSDEEGPSGLYSLKMTSQNEDENDYSSYIVAFEDHVDANNFCFLLESFFEDLGDFSADAVPMSVQEFHQAVKSRSKNVVVVKKRQLQLYAGQPLSDVEKSLCSLVEQSQNVRLADSK